MDVIPYGHQDINEHDIEAVVDVLRSPFLTQGPCVPRFEEAVAARSGARYALAVNSATSALHIACVAVGLGPGDCLWTTPNTFVASANCARYCGADVDFVDIDPATWNMSTEALSRKLAEAKRKRKLPKVVVPVHFAGQPTEQEKIFYLAQEYGFRIIEDASHSIGASRNGEPAGSCRWADIVIFSFHPVKIITTGEGGMALTNDKTFAQRMDLLRTHGITRDRALVHEADPAPWHYEQQMLGFNYRMTDLQAALGMSQLARLEQFVERRNNIARRYHTALRDLPLRLPLVLPENYSAYHLYVIRVPVGAVRKSQRQIFVELRECGIGVNVHYEPVHLQPYYRELGFKEGDFPEAERYGTEAMTLPLFPSLSEGQQEQVVAALRQSIV